MISMVNVQRSFEHITALDGITIQIPAGMLLGIMGPGGAGKSTFCKVASGLIRPDAGVLFLAGVDMMKADREALKTVQSRIGMQFQNDALFEHMTVFDNVEYPLKRKGGMSPREMTAAVMEQLAMVGLAGLEKQMPNSLSGGQRRRVALARACVTKPEILICDDPTAGLDPVTSRQILDMIAGIQYQEQNTVVVVSADVLGLLSISTQIALMWDAKIIAQGTPASLWQDKRREVKRFLDDAKLPFGES